MNQETEVETAILRFKCRNCEVINFPKGKRFKIELPYTANLKCDDCRSVDRYTWLDKKSRQDLARKTMGLPVSTKDPQLPVLEQKIAVLEASRDADRKETQLLRQLVDDLVQNKLKQVRDEASEQAQDLASLIARVKDLEDWRKFVKDEK